jgi:hypothetical protein
MALTTAAVVTAAAGAYSAYSSKRAGDKMAGLGRSQAERQSYYDNQLRGLMADPSRIYDDPGYQEAQRQGTQAVERSLAASGFVGSGNAAIELQRFGQSFATDYLRQQQQLLASLSGAQFNPASAMSAGANADAQAFSQLGSTLASLGYTFGGGGDGSTGGYGSSGSVPNTMNIGGGYIVNVPGTGYTPPSTGP